MSSFTDITGYLVHPPIQYLIHMPVYFSVYLQKNSIAYDYAGAAVSKASEFRARTQGASSFLLASLQGPIESVCLCGQVNDISLRVVFNHKQTNEIGWAGVTSAINSITSRSPTASLSLSLSLRFSPFSILSFFFCFLHYLNPRMRRFRRTWARNEDTMVQIKRNPSYLLEWTAGQIHPAARHEQVIGSGGAELRAWEVETVLQTSPDCLWWRHVFVFTYSINT